MRSLVTGASGFVGSHLIDHLIECGDEVIGTTFGEGVMVPCKTVPLDVTDREECRGQMRSTILRGLPRLRQSLAI
jgi:nucleoside-diphosphate-sugar epimerase